MDIERLEKTDSASRIPRRSQFISSNEKVDKRSFQSIINQERQSLTRGRLQAVLNKVEDHGKLLAEFRTIRELNAYKKWIRCFIDETVQNGLQLEGKRRFNHKESHVYKTVTEIDEKLLRLTDDVIRNEAGHLEILARIDEIRGLLLNVYM